VVGRPIVIREGEVYGVYGKGSIEHYAWVEGEQNMGVIKKDG